MDAATEERLPCHMDGCEDSWTPSQAPRRQEGATIDQAGSLPAIGLATGADRGNAPQCPSIMALPRL
jgi:hypothetical protein